jgi:hypothetical protein
MVTIKRMMPEIGSKEASDEVMRSIIAHTDRDDDLPVILVGEVIKVRAGGIEVHPHLRVVAAYTTNDYGMAKQISRDLTKRYGEEFVLLNYTGGLQDDTRITEIGI